MATIDRTPNGGTVGHPANVARPYVMTSKVHDTADGGTGGDIIQLIDVPADTMIVAGVLEVLEARGNSQITMDIGITGGDVDCFIDGSTLGSLEYFTHNPLILGSLLSDLTRCSS